MTDQQGRSAIRLLINCAVVPPVMAGIGAAVIGLNTVSPLAGVIGAGVLTAAWLSIAAGLLLFRSSEPPESEPDPTAITADESLRTLAQFIPGVLYSYDLYPGRPRKCNYLSTGFEELLGPIANAEISACFDRLFDRIHPDDWPRLRTHAADAAVLGTPINSEARIRHDDGSYRWVRSFGRPMSLPNDGTRWHVVVVDIQDQKDLEEQHVHIEEQLRESERQLRLITDSLPVLISYVDQTETYRFVNAAYQEWWDKPGSEICGLTIRALLGDTNYNVVRAHVKRALAGETMSYESAIVDAFGILRETHVMYVPRRTSTGAVQGFYSVVTDISTMRRDERRRRLLMRELDHRVKNNLAAVLSLAHQTLERSKTLEEFAPAFFGRIHAMSRTHELLTEAQWSGLDLERGARLVLGPYLDGGDRITLNGPAVDLPASSALPLCLTLHELATNAAKHGSLSVVEGTVAVEWTAQSDILSLRWIERDGPPVADIDTRGTGMELIRGFIEFELRGTLASDFRVAGLECEIRIPLESPGDRKPAADRRRARPAVQPSR